MGITKKNKNEIECDGLLNKNEILPQEDFLLNIYINENDELTLEDSQGRTKPLFEQIKNSVENKSNNAFFLNEKSSFKPASGDNILKGVNTIIISGEYNVNRGDYSVIISGKSNTVEKIYAAVVSGFNNVVSSDYGLIISGKNNTVDGKYSSVLNGENNETKKFTNVHIIGSNIVANRDDSTFVENLSITGLKKTKEGLPPNSLWNNKGVINIVE